MENLTGKADGVGGAAGSLPAAQWNQLPQENQNIITDMGIALSAGDLDQLGKAMAGFIGAGDFYSETGIADVYVAAKIGAKQGPEQLAAITDGLSVRFVPGNNNTGASTVAVNGLAAKDIVREDGSALAAGDLSTTRDAVLRYDAGLDDFRLMNSALSAVADPIPARGYIDGFITSNAADADHDITFGVGLCRDSTDTQSLKLSAALTKQIDVDWAEGTADGGFPSGLTLSIDTWYHLFVIRKTSDGSVDAGFDTSLTATNLLSDATGYSEFRRVGSVLTGNPANIVAYVQIEDEFLWEVPVLDQSDTNPGTGAQTVSLDFTPAGVNVFAFLSVTLEQVAGGAADTRLLLTPGTSAAATLASTGLFDCGILGDARFGSVSGHVATGTTPRVFYDLTASGASTDVRIHVKGWRDPRGRDA